MARILTYTIFSYSFGHGSPIFTGEVRHMRLALLVANAISIETSLPLPKLSITHTYGSTLNLSHIVIDLIAMLAGVLIFSSATIAARMRSRTAHALTSCPSPDASRAPID